MRSLRVVKLLLDQSAGKGPRAEDGSRNRRQLFGVRPTCRRFCQRWPGAAVSAETSLNYESCDRSQRAKAPTGRTHSKEFTHTCAAFVRRLWTGLTRLTRFKDTTTVLVNRVNPVQRQVSCVQRAKLERGFLFDGMVFKPTFCFGVWNREETRWCAR
jgi:hypothetical protein